MKKRSKKLELAAETVRALEIGALAAVQGGARSNGEDCTITSGTIRSRIVCTIG